jgi:hypothetical protein
MSENIQHIRLINGEEIIGDIIDYYDNKLLISCPLVVSEKMTPGGKSAIVLTKYMPFATTNICEISTNHIITTTDLHEEMIRYYHHSLRFSFVHEENMIKEIQSVNIMMEASLMDSYSNSIKSNDGSGSLH